MTQMLISNVQIYKEHNKKPPKYCGATCYIQDSPKITSPAVFTYKKKKKKPKTHSLKWTCSKTTLMVNKVKFAQTIAFGFNKKENKSKQSDKLN